MERMSTFRKITAGLEKKFWIFTILTPVTMICEVGCETVIPYLMSFMIDKGIKMGDLGYVVRLGLVMLGCSVVSLLCGVLGARFAAVGSQGFGRNLRRNLFQRVQGFSFANVDRFSSASLVTRLTTDVTNAQNVFQMLIRICFRAPFMLVAGIVMAMRINVGLSLVFLVSVPVLAGAIVFVSTRAYPRFGAMLEKYDRMNRIVQENLIGIRVVKAYVRGEFEEEKFNLSAEEVKAAQVRAEKIIIWLIPVMQVVVYCSLIAVFWLGGTRVISGEMLSGKLVSFLTYVTQILMSLMMIGMIFVGLVLSRASINRIKEVLDEEPDIVSPEGEGAVFDLKDGSVKFENVSFSYFKNKEKCVLRNINLEMKSGQVVGIIGSTGSGKTTLISLISRLYDVLEGTVRVGDVDVRDFDLVSLRDNVSVVLQKNVLFSGTIAENLRWGKKDASFEEIREACRAADADDFIMSFPEKYETMLGQGGVNVSGGQKQRLCIARALLKNPKVLILDDSTSAVDTATEKRIRGALRKLMPETTKIIIAQRISSVEDADVIFVLDDGCIAGKGTHQELLAGNKIYQEVYESQRKK